MQPTGRGFWQSSPGPRDVPAPANLQPTSKLSAEVWTTTTTQKPHSQRTPLLLDKRPKRIIAHFLPTHRERKIQTRRHSLRRPRALTHRSAFPFASQIHHERPSKCPSTAIARGLTPLQVVPINPRPMLQSLYASPPPLQPFPLLTARPKTESTRTSSCGSSGARPSTTAASSASTPT